MSNLYTPKLKGKTIGVVFGTFAPMHLGHLDVIMQAKKENESCLVVVSGYGGDRGDLIGLDLNKRFRYIREFYANDENIYVAKLDETNIARYPDGWKEWLNSMVSIIDSSVQLKNKKITWYVGEQEYKDELETRTNDVVRLKDRMVVPVSATKIRENPIKYWNYIVRTFRRHFSYNILVMGSASNGKTTLVRDVARSFGSPYTHEYARQYEEESNVRDEELTANDFNYIASGQFDLNRKTISSPSNNGIFIADTDVMTTKCYSKVYLKPEENEKLIPLYDMMIEKQKWDMILVIPPVTKYVNDNFRDMNHAEDSERWKMHDLMMKEIKNQGLEDKTIVLNPEFSSDGDYDNQGFYARYKEARNIISTNIEKTYGVKLY